MKTYKFKDEIQVVANSISEANEKHRLILLDCEVSLLSTIVKTSHMSICTSDGEFNDKEPYFKVYTGNKYQSAEKMCRIYFGKPEYVKGIKNSNKAKTWILNKEEKEELVRLFKEGAGVASFTKEEVTRWEYAIVRYNFERGTNQEETEKLIMEHPNYIKDKDLLPFNLPMPDYTKLT